jgi:hypothetical protein
MEKRRVGDVADHQRPPFHELGTPVAEIVERDRKRPAPRQGLAEMAADEPRPAGHEH